MACVLNQITLMIMPDIKAPWSWMGGWISQIWLTLWIVTLTINFTGTRLEELSILNVLLWIFLIGAIVYVAYSFIIHAPLNLYG